MNSTNPLFFFFLFFLLLFFNNSLGLDPKYESCVPKECENGHNISYPFYINGIQDPECGYPGFKLQCNNSSPIMRISNIDFTIKHIQYDNHLISLVSPNCPSVLNNLLLDTNRFVIVNDTTPITNLLFFSNCVNITSINSTEFNSTQFEKYRIPSCEKTEYVMVEHDGKLKNLTDACGGGRKVIKIPVELDQSEVVDGGNYREVVERGFKMRWLAAECGGCQQSGGRCGFNMKGFQFRCFCPDRPHRVSCKPEKPNRKLIAIAVLAGSVLVFALATAIFCIHKRKASAYLSSKDKSRELEDASIYFGASVFSYDELQEATHHFDPSKELGDGGFGTVYYGKLRDGREVAVKRLYDNNYKRVQQFMNEVEILTRLRHINLVSLYGCTSRKSRELLLVYEYIPNGTVADHLHGHRAKESPLLWQTRMKIAIETASALVYLHASEVIHRDVKTTNILLDNSFCVKVADFGLSRLLPNDVTHVSTVPQGTPGYVDPDYHQRYQLTYKSDVYSFGVVLIELISSMPAFDISRSGDEINLANMAINRIQRCALDELIDPVLGSDTEIEKMTTLVAELAFRCLQYDLEMRPTMSEVLEVLKRIQVEKSGGDIIELGVKESNLSSPSPENGGGGLLNGRVTASPVSVTAQWPSTGSGATTSTTSV